MKVFERYYMLKPADILDSAVYYVPKWIDQA